MVVSVGVVSRGPNTPLMCLWPQQCLGEAAITETTTVEATMMDTYEGMEGEKDMPVISALLQRLGTGVDKVDVMEVDVYVDLLGCLA